MYKSINIVIAIFCLACLISCSEREYEYPSGYRVTLYLMGGKFADNTADRVHGGIMRPTAMKNVPRLVPSEPYLRYDLPFATWNTDPYGYGDDYTPDTVIDKSLTLYAIYGVYVYDEYSLAAMECGNPDVVYVLMNSISISSQWAPLCQDPDKPFKGKLYGKGYSINFNASAAGSSMPSSAGLFSYIERANIADIVLSGSATGRLSAGIAAGEAVKSTLNRVSANGTTKAGLNTQSGDAGGLLGKMTDSRILNSSFGSDTIKGNVSATGASATAGGLAGKAMNSKIENSYSFSNINITNNNSAAGGIVGYADKTSIRNNFHEGIIKAQSGARLMAGGIAGRADDSIINACMSRSLIYAPERISDVNAGGIAGFTEGSEVSDCLADGAYITGMKAGRITGTYSGTLSNNHARDDMFVNYSIADNNSSNGISVPHSNVRKNPEYYKETLGWDFDLAWVYPNNYLYPRMEWEEDNLTTFTEVYTADDLSAMRDNMSGWYILMKDIDLADYNRGTWRSVGGGLDPFNGRLDGNGHTISNISGTGLFGYANSLSAYDLNLTNVNNTYGGLVRSGLNLTAENVNVTGNVITGSAGGLAGYATNVYIDNCSFYGEVANATIAGGIVGRLYTGYIANSLAAGVIGSISTSESATGGLIGNADNLTAVSNYTLTDIYSIGGQSGYAGGMFGRIINSEIASSYASGIIYSSSRNYESTSPLIAASGGFVGVSVNSDIRNCAAFGDNIKANYFDVLGSGGAVSYASGFAGNHTNSIFRNDYSNRHAVLTADNTTGEHGALVETDMLTQAFYTDEMGLDFSLIWRMPVYGDIRSYPVFMHDRNIITPAVGDEWYWFGIRKYYEEFQ